MAEIKYQYAYNEVGELISIVNLTKETCKDHTYRCVGCGNKLLPRAIGSTKRKAHFYHKELVECSGETYIHKLAKKLIKDKFDKSDQFLISYRADKKCDNKDCTLRNINCQKECERNEIDLKQLYDTCTEEAQIKGFIADLLFTNSKKPDMQPLLIEICVTHACEEDKLNSGLKIIEITLNNEQEVISLVEKGKIEEIIYEKKEKIM